MSPRRLVLLATAFALGGCRDFVEFTPRAAPPVDGGTVIVEVECRIDTDCRVGICDENGRCQAQLCRTGTPNRCAAAARCIPTPSQPGLGSCQTDACTLDTDCQPGFRCQRSATAANLCIDRAGVVSCRSDAECDPCAVCFNVPSDGGEGLCVGGESPTDGGRGPAFSISLDGGIRMRDHLADALRVAGERFPSARLVQVTGGSLSADGTVSLADRNNYLAFWEYAFVRDAGPGPAAFATVSLRPTFGACAFIDPQPSNVSLTLGMSNAVASQLIDATELVGHLLDGGCQPFVGRRDATDTVSWLTTEDGGVRYAVFNWQGGLMAGDGLTGLPTSRSCPP